MLLGTINETLTNQITTSTFGNASFTLAAAHLRTLTLKSTLGWTLEPVGNANVALNFGAAGQDGTVVWFTPVGSSGQAKAINVNAGKLKAGDANFSQLFQFGHSPLTVAAGATVDLAGFATSIATLEGNGTVTSSVGSPTLTLTDAIFGGVLAAAISVDVQGNVQLSGANTYTGNTTIEASGILVLGSGGTTGSISTNPIVDNGTLVINRSNTLTLANAISGTGILRQVGTGATLINSANSYNGGTSISGGTLGVGNANALGTGVVTITGGTLLGSNNLTLPNQLTMTNSFTIAAARGRTFTVGNNWQLTQTNNAVVTFGAAGRDGTVVWSQGNGTGVVTGPVTDNVVVSAGKLKAGDASLGLLLQSVAGTAVNAGATLDLAGFDTTIQNLNGQGTVTNSGALVTLTLPSVGLFEGTLNGALSLNFAGSAFLNLTTLRYTGNTVIGAGQTVRNNGGTFDFTTDAGISGSGAGATFINGGLFEKTGGTGTSVVSTRFVNLGTVSVTSGTIEMTGGLTNIGVIQGLLSGHTITANAPGQATFFGGTGDNLIEVASAPTYVDGGGGVDTLKIAGNMTLAPNSVVGIEAIEVADGVSANLANLTGPYAITLLSTAGSHASVVGSQGNDKITGGAGNDWISGGLGADTLDGAAGNDRLNGGVGGDTMSGGAGNDAYYVDNVADKVTEAANAGIDGVVSAISYALGANLESLRLVGAADINGSGNALRNTILGNAGDNVLSGRGGGDTLAGGGGSDHFAYLAIADSAPGVGSFDRVGDFVAGTGADADQIDFSHISGVTSIQGLIAPANPSETPPATGLKAHSIAWYQVGSETVVIANASATANHVDMEIVLQGVSAAGLSAASFVPAAATLLAQSAASFDPVPSLTQGAASSATAADNQQWLAAPQHA
jgi:autotransporter-associated beta strand protein